MTFPFCQLRSARFSMHVVELTLDSAFWTAERPSRRWIIESASAPTQGRGKHGAAQSDRAAAHADAAEQVTMTATATSGQVQATVGWPTR